MAYHPADVVVPGPEAPGSQERRRDQVAEPIEKDERFDAMERRMQAMAETIDALQDEVVRLRQTAAAVQDVTDTPIVDTVPPRSAPGTERHGSHAPDGLVEVGTDRRRFFTKAAVATAATAAGLVATSRPAAADNGDNLVLGQANTATNVTTLTNTGTTNNALRLEASGTFNSGLEVDVVGTQNFAIDVHTDGAIARGLRVNATGSSSRAAELRASGVGAFIVAPTGVQSIGRTALSGSGRAFLSPYQETPGSTKYAGMQISMTTTNEDDSETGPTEAHLELTPRSDVPSTPAFGASNGGLVTGADGTLWYRRSNEWTRLNDQGPTFLPVAERAYDSRENQQPPLGPKGLFGMQETRTVDLRTHTSLPAETKSVIMTVTVTNTTGAGFATVYTAGVPVQEPPTTSSINWGAPGVAVANTTTTTTDGGVVRMYCSRPTHLVIDVIGYYR